MHFKRIDPMTTTSSMCRASMGKIIDIDSRMVEVNGNKIAETTERN